MYTENYALREGKAHIHTRNGYTRAPVCFHPRNWYLCSRALAAHKFSVILVTLFTFSATFAENKWTHTQKKEEDTKNTMSTCNSCSFIFTFGVCDYGTPIHRKLSCAHTYWFGALVGRRRRQWRYLISSGLNGVLIDSVFRSTVIIVVRHKWPTFTYSVEIIFAVTNE